MIMMCFRFSDFLVGSFKGHITLSFEREIMKLQRKWGEMTATWVSDHTKPYFMRQCLKDTFTHK